eukprot:scaffold778_cov179-Ochromonas_danica.AAC.2
MMSQDDIQSISSKYTKLGIRRDILPTVTKDDEVVAELSNISLGFSLDLAKTYPESIKHKMDNLDLKTLSNLSTGTLNHKINDATMGRNLFEQLTSAFKLGGTVFEKLVLSNFQIEDYIHDHQMERIQVEAEIKILEREIASQELLQRAPDKDQYLVGADLQSKLAIRQYLLDPNVDSYEAYFPNSPKKDTNDLTNIISPPTRKPAGGMMRTRARANTDTTTDTTTSSRSSTTTSSTCESC